MGFSLDYFDTLGMESGPLYATRRVDRVKNALEKTFGKREDGRLFKIPPWHSITKAFSMSSPPTILP